MKTVDQIAAFGTIQNPAAPSSTNQGVTYTLSTLNRLRDFNKRIRL
jgi:hypothetical protein